MIHRRHLSRRLAAALALVAATLAGGCDDTPTQPAPAFAQTDLRIGSGTPAANGLRLTTHYTGWLYDATRPDSKGLQFETNVGGQPLQFVLGEGRVIQGWEQGLVGMEPGGLRRLVIPPDLAYGGTRRGPIPPNSTLIFEVEVTEVTVPQGS